MKILPLIFCSFLFLGCAQPEPQRIVRPHLEIDTLSFLVEHSDFIVHGFFIDEKGPTGRLTSRVESADAKVVDFLRGVADSNKIKVYNTARHTPPNIVTFKNFRILKEVILFLVEHDDGYKLTTDHSVVDMSSQLGWAIWNRKDGDILEFYRFSNEDILQQIKTALTKSEQGGSLNFESLRSSP